MKQPAKRKRQQTVNQADKPTTDVDKAVEAAQQLVAFKKFAVARQKAAKAVPYNSCVWRSKKTRRPRTFATADTLHASPQEPTPQQYARRYHGQNIDQREVKKITVSS